MLAVTENPGRSEHTADDAGRNAGQSTLAATEDAGGHRGEDPGSYRSRWILQKTMLGTLAATADAGYCRGFRTPFPVQNLYQLRCNGIEADFRPKQNCWFRHQRRLVERVKEASGTERCRDN